ncbi:MAG TPA: altronate dehydratase family protein [Roseiflexaceae bacterium]|nr:altronate dehydratase family protein [Roseiflexaceae bacterium]
MLITLQDTPALRLHPDDDVAIALVPLSANRRIEVAGHSLRLSADIGAGHKLALRGLETGQPVRRYGQVIGFATRPIAPGDFVHSHNLAVGDMQLDYQFGTDIRPIDLVPPEERRTFLGYRRADGRAGTRNTIAIIGTVNCSAHTLRQIAARARAELLPMFPNVTDIVGLAHKNGCASATSGQEIELLRRTLAGFARHPNVAGYLFVGLGCEANQFEDLLRSQRNRLGDVGLPPYIGIQDTGGVAATIEAGLQEVARLLPRANEYRREPVPVSELALALQCGGSDGFSGITGNPALGHAVDLLVQQGGTAVLSETPEVYGAEHLLTRRAVSREVGEKLIGQIRWWEAYTEREGFVIDNNPAPGNKAGGLTTIYEKSLGAVAKGGSMPLQAVYDYAEPITEHGFTFMDTPGYDPVSATGQVAGGCNIIAFTTGRGSCFGFKPAPSIKIATNSVTYDRMKGDMDINAGRVLEGASIEEVGREIFEKIIAVASGQPSLSEAQGIGEEEFNPWILGVTL